MTTGDQHHHDRIVIDPGILAGKPAVKGTRIPVDLVLLHLAENPDVDELFASYPRLTLDDVKAVLAYAYDAVSRPHGSPWLNDLYDYFAPVRQEAEEKGYSDDDINAAIDRALASVRAEHA